MSLALVLDQQTPTEQLSFFAVTTGPQRKISRSERRRHGERGEAGRAGHRLGSPVAGPSTVPVVAAVSDIALVPGASRLATRLGAVEVIADNLAVLELLVDLRSFGRDVTAGDRAVLERWHGWGAAAALFAGEQFAAERERLVELVGRAGFDAARRTVLNAHYTDPGLVAAMWSTVGDFGVVGGTFLEPGCGRGTFLAGAPAGFAGLGVELDPTTAEVARLCNPNHEVIAGDFAAVGVVEGSAALAIGNVPFAKLGLYDGVHNRSRRLSIHDHFIVKSLAALAPGGLGLFVTSRYSLDKAASYARAAMGRYADFLGAVRLPSSAHLSTAGTSVVTDVVAFRRRELGTEAVHADGFVDPVVPFGEASDEVEISAYFATHPERVLGEMAVAPTMYRRGLVVTGEMCADALAAALRAIAAERPMAARPTPATSEPGSIVVMRSTSAPVGRIERDGLGFRRYGEAGWAPHDAGRSAAELGQLVEMRDLARSLVDLEQSGEAAGAVEERRAELREAYETYTASFGPVNRVTISAAGRRSYPRMGGFRSDPGFVRVAALERYDEATGVAEPASLLVGRRLRSSVVVESVTEPVDALAVSIAECGRLDVELVASLLGCASSEVEGRLAELAFRDPATDGLVDAMSYLSGNVRRKLAEARERAEFDASLARNVAALEAVVPADIGPDELERVIGASWIGTELVEEFARSLVPDSVGGRSEVSVSYTAVTGEWVVRCPSWVTMSLRAGHEFGTREMDAMAILQHALNAKSPVVRAEDADGRVVVLADATQAAIEKAQLLVEAFDDWLLRENPERSATALRSYNETFNSYVARPYGEIEIPTPGLASDFTLRPHQKAAVARAVLSGNTGLWHEVGTGKTAVMVVAAMEQKRLGLIARPMFVVANNMLSQFATDLVRLYPAAEVLVIDKDDVSAKSRALFAARVRSHDYDAIVISHSSFTRWPVSPNVEARYRQEKIAELYAELTTLGSGEVSDAGRVAVKKIEKRIASHEARLSEMSGMLVARRDEHDMYFDQSGVDFLLVDEADEFKNAEMHSCVNGLRGVAVGKGSQRAFDLDVKLSYLRSAYPSRQCIQATGTPISNTVAELWVFARYLRPDLLDELGVASFDDFRRQFCDTVSAMELDVTQSYRRVERLARYKNLPELARLLAEFADIVRAEDIGLERPELVGGRRQVVAVPPAPELERFIRDELTSRVEAVRSRRVTPDEDNMLKLSGDARFASFDWTSFRGEPVADEHSSIAAAAQNIARIYHEHRDREYLSEAGVAHPRPGALQLVFSDLATPGGSRGHNAYEALRARLVGLGVPAEMVRFAHEFDRGDEAMAEMAERCRDGRIAVLIGSTAKLGVGVNVQDRAVALHHLDCPWRPRDVEQREGRICRQGNQNGEVAIYAYVSERSFFVYGWQTVERKAAFVGQVMRATPDGPRPRARSS